MKEYKLVNVYIGNENIFIRNKNALIINSMSFKSVNKSVNKSLYQEFIWK